MFYGIENLNTLTIKMAVKIYTMEARELSTPILILTPVKWILADLVPPNEAQYQSRERVGAKFKSTFEVKQSLQIFQEKQFCQIYQHERLSLGNNTQ